MRKLVFCIALGVTPVASHGYQVSFATTNCDGDTGFAAVEIELIYRIDTVDCAPAQPDKRLKQVLVRARGTGYDVFTVDEAEAKKISEEINSYSKARKRALERGETLQIIPY